MSKPLVILIALGIAASMAAVGYFHQQESTRATIGRSIR
jgi:hypothetical protein